MITRISIILFSLSLSAFSEEPKEEKGVVYQISPVLSEIPGTVLWQQSYHRKPEGGTWSQASCVIGYKAESANGDQMRIVPILALPMLKKDSYEIQVVAGILRISEKRSQKTVMSLHIDNLVPALLTTLPEIDGKSEAEQAGTGKPATRPESESEGSDKPQPESEGRSR